MGGGGSTQTSTGIPNEAGPGYNAATQYYQNTLANPPVYGGQRAAGPSAVQNSLFGSADSLLNPSNAQAAASGLAQPMFQQFQQQVMPGIEAQSQSDGQGVTGSRRQVATDEAIQNLGQSIGQGAVAPIYDQQAANVTAENTVGSTQQALNQAQLTAQQQLFEEPIFRQSAAAQGLTQLAGMGSNTTSTSTMSPYSMAMSGLGTAGSAGLGTAALMGKLAPAAAVAA